MTNHFDKSILLSEFHHIFRDYLSLNIDSQMIGVIPVVNKLTVNLIL